jgi:hypothetical protein
MHLDDEQVQRVLHRELIASDAAGIDAHLAGCATCRDAVTRARAAEAEIFGLLRSVDHSHQALDLADVRRRPDRRTVAPARYGRWAAAILAAVGLAGVAYAVPSSPLRRWLEEWRRTPRVQVAPTPGQAPERSPDIGGVSIAAGSPTVVLFVAAQATGEARVRLADVTDIAVRAPAGSARFAVAPGRLTIDNRGATIDYDILVPRHAPRVEIRVAGVRVWLKDGDRVVSDAPRDIDGATRVRLDR